jgi:hypothetical protein
MRLARNQRAWRGAWNKTVETHGGKVGDTENPIIKGIMPDGSEAPGHRGRWKETETSNPRDKQWFQTYREGRSARLKRSDAVRSSIERIAAGVLAGTMALTGRGLLMTPNNAEKAMRAMPVHLRQVETEQQGETRMNLKEQYKHRLDEGVVGRVMKKLKRTGELLKAVFTQNLSPGQRLQINRNIRRKEQQGGTGMNLKEQYKQRLEQRMLEDLQTPERAEEMSKAVRDAAAAQKISRRLGFKTGVQVADAIVKAVSDRDKMEKRDPKLVYGKGGRVVGKVVPTKGSAARTR